MIFLNKYLLAKTNSTKHKNQTLNLRKILKMARKSWRHLEAWRIRTWLQINFFYTQNVYKEKNCHINFKLSMIIPHTDRYNVKSRATLYLIKFLLWYDIFCVDTPYVNVHCSFLISLASFLWMLSFLSKLVYFNRH